MGEIKIIPDIIISGESASDASLSGLMGMKLMEMIDTNSSSSRTKPE